jgi:hypothetical protein
MRLSWTVGVGVVLGVSTSLAPAQETAWRPVIAQTPVRAAATAADSSGDLGVSLGRPIPVALDRPIPINSKVAVAPSPVPPTAPTPSPSFIVRAQASEVPPAGSPVVPPPPPGAPIIVGDSDVPGAVPGAPGSTWWGKTKGYITGDAGPVLSPGGRSPFQSDHAFDHFISPVSSPFEFEDPRALTEVRPIFILQSIPSKNPVFHGGTTEFFGMQARLALTENWSIVMSKLGGIALQPNSGAFGDASGFAEIDLGPKWTFLRNECTGTLGALGLNFDIPAGNSNVFQNTGTLSLFPYLTMGQTFCHSKCGAFNALGSFGYSISTDNKRSEYFDTNLHLDYDLYNMHRIYPLVELSWRYYTQAGKTTNFGFEGGDLYNFGSQGVSGRNNLDLAIGARFKCSECWQIGTAFSWPVVGTKDINDFRWTFDMIFRY